MSNINWNETYINISPKLLGICRRYIKDAATAEDIVQDSFIVAIQKENTLKNANALNGWLSRIVINMAIHHLKEIKKINFSAAEDYDLVDNSTLMNNLEMDNKSMLLASDISRDDILEAIDSLPEHHRSVFNMYVIDQFSHNEIAKTLTISVGTSKSNLSRARKAIQSFLFEKLKLKSVDEKKKRRIALLLLFGLENKMFAHFYQSKFRDFEIDSKKPIPLAQKNVSVPTGFIGSSYGLSVSKIAIFSIVFLLFTGFGFYAFHLNILPENAIEKQQIQFPEAKPEIETNLLITDYDSIENQVVSVDQTEQVISNAPNSKSKPEKKSLNATQQNTEKPIVEIQKDTAKTETKKVIVVKNKS